MRIPLPSASHVFAGCQGLARIAALVLVPVAASAQDGGRTMESALATGQVSDSLRATRDSSERFAVYLPPGYDRTRRWPIMLVLDPRGRARLALDRFVPAAERLGWILVSSYNTLSDGPREPNDRALDAMLGDAQRALAIDTRRLYLAGFSGTARFAWDVSGQFPGALAGIIGAGAGLPGDLSWLDAHRSAASFAFFGTIGTLDPNYEEMRAVDAALDRTRLPHRLVVFEGGHEWPPVAVASAAVDAMELDAMRRGLRVTDSAWVASVSGARLADVARLERRGELLSALDDARALSRDLASWPAADSARDMIARLSADPRVRKASDRARDLAVADHDFAVRMFAVLREARDAPAPLSAGELRRRMGLDVVRRMAERASDSLGAPAARRLLARVMMQASLYEPREYFSRGEPARAEAVLRLAAWISPDDGLTCAGLSRALAARRALQESLAALACAIDHHAIGHAAMEREPWLAPLRLRPEWPALLGRSSEAGGGER
jgi:predicted esterase